MQPRSCPVEAQSVKNTGRAHRRNTRGYDAGKKVSVIKWRIGVDTTGVAACHCGDHGASDGLSGSGADIGAVQVEAATGQGPCCVTVAIGGNPSPEGVKAILGDNVSVQMARRNEWHSFTVIPQCWALSVGSWNESFIWPEKHR